MTQESGSDPRFFGTGSSHRARETYLEVPLEASTKGFELGPYNSENFYRDPKRLAFLFSRYKFVSKMLEGRGQVLEVGCQEGLGSVLVAKTVGHLVASDFFRDHVESCRRRLGAAFPDIEFLGHDMVGGPIPRSFDAAFALDVFEHIDPAQEDAFMGNLVASLSEKGVLILGIPSLEFQAYASPASREGHINCKSGKDLKAFCEGYFDHVFMFGMSDEVVHTGFLPMASYLLALCVQPRVRNR